MKIIKIIVNQIEEELEGAEDYIYMAIAQKEHYPALSKTVYEISLDEMHHVEMLHGIVVNMIEEHRRTKGEPPKEMMDIYEFMHEKHIKLATKIKLMQSEYKK